MQGISRADRDLWDAGDLTGHLVPPGSVFAFLAEHRPEGGSGPGDQHRRHRGAAYPQVQVQAPRRVPRARGGRAGDRADHRLRDDDGRRGRQHRCGERGEDGRPRPVPFACGRPRRAGAAAGRAAAGQAGQEDAGPRDGQGLEVYGDSAYGSGEARAAYRDAGHDTVIKPGPVRPAVPGGFTIDDFTVNEDEGTVTCPAGQVRLMSRKRAVTFGAACAACPLREMCTTAAGGRSMTIHPQDGLLRAARAQARTGEFKKACPARSSIERTIAWIATQNGRRVRLRYIGTAKNDAWLHTRCAALNLRTLLKAGLTRSAGAWVLA